MQCRRRKGRRGVGLSSSVLHGLPRVPAQTQGCHLLQDLDLDTASPMSPASPATPRAMPPAMAMPTSPIWGEEKGDCPRGQTQSLRGPWATTSRPAAPWQKTCLSLESWCEGPQAGKEEGLRRNCLEGII